MFNGEIKENNHDKYVSQNADITGEEGSKLAYQTNDGVYQH